MDTGQKLSQFEDRVRREVAIIFPEASLAVVERRRYLLKVRIGLGEKTLNDIFYNPKNDSNKFALKNNHQRILSNNTLEG